MLTVPPLASDMCIQKVHAMEQTQAGVQLKRKPAAVPNNLMDARWRIIETERPKNRQHFSRTKGCPVRKNRA